MVDNRACADVEFLVGEEATPVYASKVILIARSPVFEALLNGSFREGLPPTSSVSCSTSASPSLPPIFWHSVSVPDLEPHTMRHLLYWCYTNSLHPELVPDDDDADTPSQHERDLMHLYAAADRYLLQDCCAIVTKELRKEYSTDTSRVLATFDLALDIAPKLAKGVCLKAISTNAFSQLGGDDPDIEQQWLGLSLAAAEELLAADLEGIEEVDLYGAIERRYQHHLPFPDEEQTGAQVESESAAFEQVASLINLIETRLMTTQEIREVVEPSGLFSTEDLMKTYRRAARSYRFVVPDLHSTPTVEFDDRVAHGKVTWRISVSPDDTAKTNYKVLFIIEPRKNVAISSQVSRKGVSLTVFLNRRCIKQVTWSGSGAVPGRVAQTIKVDSTLFARLTILVRVPAAALREIGE
jgi:hypothetical protein